MDKSGRRKSVDLPGSRNGESPENESDNNANGSIFSVFICMEDLIDKLKLLNYETEFVKEFNIKPFPK
jgi:hypothetical protein